MATYKKIANAKYDEFAKTTTRSSSKHGLGKAAVALKKKANRIATKKDAKLDMDSQEESVFARALAVKTSPRKASEILARIQEARRVEVDRRYADDIDSLEEILSTFEDSRDAVLDVLNRVKTRGEAGQMLFDAMTKGDGGDESFFDVVNAAMYGDVGPDTVSIQDAIEALDEGEPE